MQVVKLIIPGKYWDTLLYRGRLCLFDLDGDLRVLEWDSLVDTLQIPEELHYPFWASFIKGNECYTQTIQKLLRDAAFKDLLQDKFNQLSKQNVEISYGILDKITFWHESSPFPFPHSDSLIYGKQLYTVGKSGLFGSPFGQGSLRLLSARVIKYWDCPVLSASASYGNIALAAGNEGLYELPLFEDHQEPHIVSHNDCTNCNWNYFSIYCSSNNGVGYMAEYSFNPRSGDILEDQGERRHFERTVGVAEIFGQQDYSWGSRDKIYSGREGSVQVVKYDPWQKTHSQFPFSKLGTIQLESWKGQIISAKVAIFGIVIECEHAIVIVPSDGGQPITISGDVVNWRVFPRSVYYENHLHIIYEDRIEILAFTHDFFVDQKSKLAGYISQKEKIRWNLTY